MPPPKFRCLTDAEAIPQIPQGPDAGNKWAQLERSRAETPARVQVLRDGNGNTRPELVAQGKADDELLNLYVKCVGCQLGQQRLSAER
jgi:hypothetical protein